MSNPLQSLEHARTSYPSGYLGYRNNEFYESAVRSSMVILNPYRTITPTVIDTEMSPTVISSPKPVAKVEKKEVVMFLPNYVRTYNVKVKPISKQEFIELEKEDIIKEWRELLDDKKV